MRKSFEMSRRYQQSINQSDRGRLHIRVKYSNVTNPPPANHVHAVVL